MTIVRYEPWARTVAWIPSVDVHEEADRYVVRADLPGVAKDDIEITADAGILTIKVSASRRSSRAKAATSASSAWPAASSPLHPAGCCADRCHQGDAREWRPRAVDPETAEA